ncbi:MAG TPA: potassium transporter, partial [Erythrobacter sp.]|nr:potassium transporter [Erythrobacter sp.]
YYGDATRPDLLASAGIDRARILVVALDEREQIDRLVRYACANFPGLHVVARAKDRDHVYHLWAMGCRDIVRET